MQSFSYCNGYRGGSLASWRVVTIAQRAQKVKAARLQSGDPRAAQDVFGQAVAAGQAIGHSVATQCRAKLKLVVLRGHSVAARSVSDMDLCASGPDRCRFPVTGRRRGETATVINYIFAHRQLY